MMVQNNISVTYEMTINWKINPLLHLEILRKHGKLDFARTLIIADKYFVL